MKTIMITGADSGLGLETAKKLAKDHNNQIILACRNNEKAEKAKEEIMADSGNNQMTIESLDTSRLSSVRECVHHLYRQDVHLDALVCNAGISPAHSGMTDEGFELVFATNYLGHYLLTMELLMMMNPRSRIVHVTSDMHNPPQGISWKGADYLAYHAQHDRQRYSYSKLCNILFTYRLADELKRLPVSFTVNCFNPGFMADTNFSGGHHGGAHALIVKKTMPERYGTLAASSTALASLVTDSAYDLVSGQYFDRDHGIGESSKLSHDSEVQNELWEKSQTYAGIDAQEILKKLKIERKW